MLLTVWRSVLSRSCRNIAFTVGKLRGLATTTTISPFRSGVPHGKHKGARQAARQARSGAAQRQPALCSDRAIKSVTRRSPPATGCGAEDFSEASGIMDRIADKNVVHKNEAGGTRPPCRATQGCGIVLRPFVGPLLPRPGLTCSSFPSAIQQNCSHRLDLLQLTSTTTHFIPADVIGRHVRRVLHASVRPKADITRINAPPSRSAGTALRRSSRP